METSRRGIQAITRGLIALALCLTHQSVFALPAYEKVGPLFSDGGISIYPESQNPRSQVRDWCGSRRRSDTPAKLEIVYDGTHATRDALFPQGYEAFVDTAARSVINQHCSDFNPANVELYFYRRGESEYLDKIQFQLRDGSGANSVARVSESINTQHPSSKRLAAENELGRCSGKPFCDLAGGIYLNAIYEDNEALIRTLDQKIMDEALSANNMKGIQDFVAALSGNFSEDNSHVDPFGLRGTSILKIMANKYMAEYGSNHYRSASGACLQDNSVSITRNFTTDVIRYENQLGIDQGSVGGDTFSEAYTINPEFESLCNKICDHLGEGGSYLFETGSLKAALVFAGTSQIRTEVDCNSAEVKQFERNLISLTERSLRWQPLPSAPARVELTDAQKAQETKRLFMEAMEEREAQSETPQVQSTQTPRTRTGTRPDQTNASRQGETSRLARLESQPVIDESVLYNLGSNIKAGEEFLRANKNNDGVVETSSGLQYRIITSGSGTKPTSSNQVTAHMRGTLINGRVFADTYANGQALTLSVGQVIKGLGEGLQHIDEGGKIQIFIPPTLAYGNQAIGSTIPAGSTLIYEIELISID